MTVSVGLSGLGLRGAGSVRGRRFSDLGVLEQLRSLTCYDVSHPARISIRTDTF